ncbi:hypothetical protein HanXRQr2_Chr07g0298821 [Helianthus annuus]|uniref:Uncharacterized protein n=1 Tax=Helianthus annuus TaxID=4232 RepID=A0A251T8D3_HELAN|nr:hypothetical protein HanXRQr2_Chr07g0298821 [Helianthus annuus]
MKILGQICPFTCYGSYASILALIGFSRQHYVTFRKRWFNHMGTTNGLTLWEFGRSGILKPLLGY